MKTKIILFMIIVVLFTIFIAQNTHPVNINVFFWQFNVSSIILIILTGFVGVLIGLLLGSLFKPFRKDNDKENIL
ncbi:MAG: LapA family protein [Ignavibacteriaceae bacterium]|nr:LapA family protein [Ignavibacteriaceae bacterium]